MSNPPSAFFKYWGKANPAFSPPGHWHPLPFHSLDVASVGQIYLAAHGRLLDYFAAQMGIDAELTRRWLCFWLSLHDLGKFATAFQAQRLDLLEDLQQRSTTLQYTVRHDTLGDFLWKSALLEQHDALELGARRKLWGTSLAPWIAAVTGHHGQPPLQTRIHRDQHFMAEDEVAAAEYVRAVRALFLPGDTLHQVLAIGRDALAECGRRLSWWLAGVAVLADWLGSNTEFFPYCPQPMALDEYWAHAQANAHKALAACDLLPARSAAAHSVASLFGWEGAAQPRSPTPLQAWAESVALPDEPQLYLLEDVTGAGKTEAAMILAQRLMACGQAEGLFVGLPTMATSNAMYERLAAIAPRLFAEGERASVVLAHGQRDLVERFSASIAQAGIVESDDRQSDETASARCAAWLADSRKKSLLAHVGVGTIDQALLAILHARHQSLRLLGLFGKVLIVDEVHACDAYMQRLLEGLLRFHAAAGGSAILLSATLPARMKAAFAAAFCKGLGASAPVLTETEYPLATRITANTSPLQIALGTRPDLCRRVAVDYIDDEDAVRQRIVDALARGHCVCWIRNTVADALAAYDRFEPLLAPDKLALFHARFTLADRLRIEQDVLKAFGPHSTPDDRRGRLLIATQVVEQSLDLDFDLLVSDLAPIDRLIQRGGRLHRHRRDRHGQRVDRADEREAPRLLVYGPTWTETPAADWYAHRFRGASYVYPHPGQLWRTAQYLKEGGWTLPDECRDLIEFVFGNDEAELPEALQPQVLKVEGKDWAASNHADSTALDLDNGYTTGERSEWSRDDDLPRAMTLDDWSGVAATRLGELSRLVRLARWQGGLLEPWHDHGQDPWTASSLRLTAQQFDTDWLPAELGPLVEQLKQVSGRSAKWWDVLPLCPDGNGDGQLVLALGGRALRYSSKRGLTLVRQ